MTARNKLELKTNTPTPIELLYDKPVIGESRYGSYILYAVKSNGNEYAFFAPEEVHCELHNLSRGDTAMVTKLAAQHGTEQVTKYIVEAKTSNKESGNDNNGTVKSDPGTTNRNPIPKTDTYFRVMLESYQEALEIQEELSGIVDVDRIAITLFIARSKTPFNGNNR